MKNVIDFLQKRGFIEAITHEEIKEIVQKRARIYVGFDPTADSLHLGNYIGIVALSWFQKFGHQPVVILGGATGRIGDPSGKSKERPLLSEEEIQRNIQGIRRVFEKILDFSNPETAPIILDNYEWFKQMDMIHFLRDVGKHFRMGPMLSKESVKTRLNSEEGMSFTEFSYQMLQAYDFHYLLENYQVSIQAGGSDQWGNITAGTEFVRKRGDKHAFGWTFPLLLRSDGKKFGKSEEGAIWLSEEKLSPYQFYQYLIAMPDADIPKMLRMLTFLPEEEMAKIETEMQSPSYVPNSAQRRLAEEVTRIVHGEEGVKMALKVTEAAAPGASAELDPAVLREVAKDMPSVHLEKKLVLGIKVSDLFALSGLTTSKGEAVRLITNGGGYLNNNKLIEAGMLISEEHLVGGEFILIASGKKKKILVKVI